MGCRPTSAGRAGSRSARGMAQALDVRDGDLVWVESPAERVQAQRARLRRPVAERGLPAARAGAPLARQAWGSETGRRTWPSASMSTGCGNRRG